MTISKHTNSYKPSRLSSLPPIVLGALAGMDVQKERRSWEAGCMAAGSTTIFLMIRFGRNI